MVSLPNATVTFLVRSPLRSSKDPPIKRKEGDVTRVGCLKGGDKRKGELFSFLVAESSKEKERVCLEKKQKAEKRGE